jgi:hypothetical protein
MEFKDLGTPPYSILNASIALESIGELINEEINLKDNPYGFSSVGNEAKRLCNKFGVEIIMIGYNLGQINVQIQSLIDKLIQDNYFTLEVFKITFEKESKKHPKR